MELKSKVDIYNGRPILKIYVYGRYRSLTEISKLPGIDKHNFSADMLLHRWNSGKRTEAEFLKPKRAKRKNATKPTLPEHIEGLTLEQIDELGAERPLLIYDQGYHKEKRDGEILIGYFSMQWISEEVPWSTKRISTIPKNKRSVKPQYPLFIQRSEAIEKGFIVI